MKKSVFLLITAILLFCKAGMMVGERLVMGFLTRILGVEYLRILALTSTAFQLVGAVLFFLLPCILLLLAAKDYQGKTKKGLFFAAMGNGLQGLMTIVLWVIGSGALTYPLFASAVGIRFLLFAIGCGLITAEPAGSGWNKGIAVAAGITALFDALAIIGTQMSGMMLTVTGFSQTWVMFLSVFSAASLFTGIIAHVLEATLYLCVRNEQKEKGAAVWTGAEPKI